MEEMIDEIIAVDLEELAGMADDDEFDTEDFELPDDTEFFEYED